MDTVKYIGVATKRMIRDKEWEQAGVTGQDTVVWDAGNGYTVNAAKLSQAAKDALKPDPFFVFSDKSDSGKSEGRVIEEAEIDLDVAKEYESIAKANTTSDGSGLDEAPEKDQKRRGE